MFSYAWEYLSESLDSWANLSKAVKCLFTDLLFFVVLFFLELGDFIGDMVSV